ncbi:LuxR C-terminal-related transcriptional regulator, partial [Klebsiella quasivariicola]|uniref:LuxR C-terminal-related transcriptional regulator n=1 Tax=Klebsiella quasivariicola TaxID=2026240 RepID=UPI00109D1C80
AQIREILISESAWEEMTCLFAPSLSPHEVAAALKISHKTIHSHKKNIMSKFNLNSRQQFNNLVQLLTRR